MDDLYTINTLNGVLDFRTGACSPKSHALEDKRTSVDFYRDAACPEWERFVERSMGGDPERIRRLRMAVGYTLTGSTKLRKMFVCHGGAGKTTLLSVLRALLDGYAALPLHGHFLRPKASRPRDTLSEVDQGRLRGVRLATLEIPSAGRRAWKRPDIGADEVKPFVSGEPMVGRLLYREPFSFDPMFKLWATAREKPDLEGDQVLLSRLEFIEFQDIDRAEIEPGLGEKLLRRESHGIFAWAAWAAMEWCGS